VLEVCWYGAGADKISQIRAGAGGAGADKKIQPAQALVWLIYMPLCES